MFDRSMKCILPSKGVPYCCIIKHVAPRPADCPVAPVSPNPAPSPKMAPLAPSVAPLGPVSPCPSPSPKIAPLAPALVPLSPAISSAADDWWRRIEEIGAEGVVGVEKIASSIGYGAENIWKNIENVGENIWKGVTDIGQNVVGTRKGIMTLETDIHQDADYNGENILFGAQSDVVEGANGSKTDIYERVDSSNYLPPNVAPLVAITKPSGKELVEPLQTSESNAIWIILLIILAIVVIYFVSRSWNK